MSKTNGNDPAFAVGGYDQGEKTLYSKPGLTKRELFAAIAMGGLLQNATVPVSDTPIVAITLADALIKNLNKDA